jgi:hypothetical protein
MSKHDDNRNEERCVLCGKSRQENRHLRLILGVHGGVCVDCVYLCLELIETKTVPVEPGMPFLGQTLAQPEPPLL